MPTRGTIVIDGERFEVTGESWMDHEFGTSFLEPEQQGWDWLSIQLDDGRELMLYQLRRADGTRDPRSSGTLVDAQGGTHASRRRRVHARARPHLSRAFGRGVSGGLDDSIPSRQIALDVTTPLENQELATASRRRSRIGKA